MASESEFSSQQNLNSKQRIDMGHGFMKSVIRNQIDRDNYDREIKAKQQKGKPQNRSKRTKKPEIQTYVPPQRCKKDDLEFLFSLEYEHKNGDIMKIDITQNDQPYQIAKRVGMKYDFTDAFVTALAQRIQEEMDGRLV